MINKIDELIARAAQARARQQAHAAAIRANTCPHCHASIEHKEQQGRHVVAMPCRHTLYQGFIKTN